MQFRQLLRSEFESRRQRNPLYSLRAFARDLKTDHATISQIIRGTRRLTPAMVRLLGARLKVTSEAIREACMQQDGEVVLRLAREPDFRPNCRWLAIRGGLSLDAVNAALHWLLLHGELVMNSTQHWTVTQSNHV